MDGPPCFDGGYLAFTWANSVFVLTYGGPNSPEVPRTLPTNDHAKHGLRCGPNSLQVLVEEPYPSDFFSIVSFAVSRPGPGSIELSGFSTRQPVPAEFQTGRFAAGRHSFALTSPASRSLFELTTETSTESVPGRGLFHYLTVT